MRSDGRLHSARTLVRLGHLLAGGAALVFAGVMVVTGRAPNAELGGVLVGLGLLLALVALAFVCAAVVALRRTGGGRHGLLSLTLSIVELVAGATMAVAVGVAVQGYGAFEPWRSPLLLPSALLMSLGLAGLAVEGIRPRSIRRPSSSSN
jgi:hypothetical protein